MLEEFEKSPSYKYLKISLDISIIISLLVYFAWLMSNFFSFLIHPFLLINSTHFFIVFICLGILYSSISFAFKGFRRILIPIATLLLGAFHLLFGFINYLAHDTESISYEKIKVHKKWIYVIKEKKLDEECAWVGECYCWRCKGEPQPAPEIDVTAYIRHRGVYRKVKYKITPDSKFFYDGAYKFRRYHYSSPQKVSDILDKAWDSWL